MHFRGHIEWISGTYRVDFVQDVESSLAGNHELDIRPQSTSARQRKILKVRIMKCRKFLNVRITIYIFYIIY